MELFDNTILKKIGCRFLQKKQSIAVAESVTSGLLQFALAAMPDAALFFQGGMTAYNIAQKYKHLKVEPLHALSVDCVSPKVAKEMALQVCRLYSSDWGIGITGYASPVPESGNKVFAFYAICYKGKIKVSGKINPEEANSQELQLRYVNQVLKKLSVLI